VHHDACRLYQMAPAAVSTGQIRAHTQRAGSSGRRPPVGHGEGNGPRQRGSQGRIQRHDPRHGRSRGRGRGRTRGAHWRSGGRVGGGGEESPGRDSRRRGRFVRDPEPRPALGADALATGQLVLDLDAMPLRAESDDSHRGPPGRNHGADCDDAAGSRALAARPQSYRRRDGPVPQAVSGPRLPQPDAGLRLTNSAAGKPSLRLCNRGPSRG
jgi:hypothetical protein